MTASAAEPPGPDRYRAQAVAAIGAVEVRPPRAFLWFGRRVAAPAHADRAEREVLVHAIGQRLHADFYGPGAPRAQDAGPVTAPDDGSEFLRALSQANCGRGSWQAGWRVQAVLQDAMTVVRADGLRLLAPAGDCRVDGAQADVRVAKELLGFFPGFYVALGDTPPAPGPPVDLLRLCWNIAAAGAVTFVARVTYALNGASLPFSLRLLDNPARYERRAGGAVLLLATADFGAAIKLLRPLLRTLGQHLADAAPPFTKPLARGLALAEEPSDGLSFGEDRCGLLAQAIVTASERGLRTVDGRLAVVREQFHTAGLTLDAPYLRPGSEDAYDLS